jgi:hypothetical protein
MEPLIELLQHVYHSPYTQEADRKAYELSKLVHKAVEKKRKYWI